MNRPLPHLLVSAVMAATVTLASLPTDAKAAAYDPPTISVVRVAPSYVKLQVTAGPSGAPNGFYVEWMYKSVFDALGGWPGDPYDPSLYYCIFDGQPAWHVGGVNGYKLGPGESIDIVLGELFDESGVTTDYTDEISRNQGVVIHGYTEGDAVNSESAFTPDLVSATTAGDNCTFTVGYWKNHPGVWPAGCLPMTLGTVSYTQAQLLQILNYAPAGNGLVILAHQLIAAKLNICNGADGSAIAATIADADALIGGLVIPPVGGGYLAPSVTNTDTNQLDDYNNGFTGPGHCGATPARHSTWGRIKSMYR